MSANLSIKSRCFLHAILTLLVAAAVMGFMPWSAYADGVQLTLSASNPQIPEGGSLDLVITATNNLDQTITTFGGGFGFSIFPSSGDFTDNITSIVFGPQTFGSSACFGPLASGGSCVFDLIISTANEVGEAENDFGVTPVFVQLEYQTDPNGSFLFATAQPNVTVTDAIATPEPSSFLLLGAELVVLAGLTSKQWLR